MPSNVDAQLTWLATRYVLGELSEADRATFEQRLADDLVACEAVVEASRLKSGLRAALAKLEPGEPVHRASMMFLRRSQLAVGTVVTAVACLLVVSLIQWPANLLDQTLSHSGAESVELVVRWRTGMNFNDVEVDDADDDSHESAADMAIPGWMLAGVSLQQDPAPDGSNNEMKDN
jgi:ferric-dicitrate binding protein FerR (iron transport regulator)